MEVSEDNQNARLKANEEFNVLLSRKGMAVNSKGNGYTTQRVIIILIINTAGAI